MTEVATTGGGTVAGADEFDDNLGLEDVDASDLVIPRIQIVHGEGKFKDSLSGATFDVLDAVLLGIVKQRVYWHPVVDDGDRPMCKSPDFEHGFPNENDEQPKEKRFPWAKSNFKPEDFPPEAGINGLRTLPCARCVFAEWDKGDWKTPPCAEQHTFPLLYTLDDGETYAPGLFTVQKTGIKPSRTYISSFASAKRPLFTVRTKITLKVNTRGTVTYSVPAFMRGEESNRNSWEEYGSTYRRVREIIRSAPTRREEEGDVIDADVAPAANANVAPPTAAASAPVETPAGVATPAPAATPVTPEAAPAAPVASAASASADDDDDLPF